MILNKGVEVEAPVTLSKVNAAGRYRIEDVSGNERDRHRLHEMGFVAGAPLEVVSCYSADMLVVKLGGCRMALSRGTTENVRVRSR